MGESLQVIREHLDKQSLASYIILDGESYGEYKYPDLLVNMLVGDYGKTWEESHKVLHTKDSLMINPIQFWDFRDLIKSGKVYDGNGSKVPRAVLKAINDEIFKVRTPLRAEWLNAKFRLIDEKWQMSYDNRIINGKLKSLVSEPLEDCLMQDGYINLRSINRQGMPTRQAKKSEICYMPPLDGAVARFVAYSAGADFDCSKSHLSAGSGCGVRRVKIFRGKQ